MMTTINVKAAPGLRVPREDNGRKYITDKAFSVEQTIYYLRRLADGDLVHVDDTQAAGQAAPTDAVAPRATTKKGA
ncbi:DUF2635 domain-containing protein [Achromobacter seleniivolatilans]|uniref:DUF2635 domain-containing protein n=1 Tax=Achromobacter seleniivolatilans TaxID=3047478 RepID=A0ABY9M7Z5_9BURK|nr:DUF2635 domain-containing protein [Achromobacter sp. R39]WMD23099.1 DUF2635 domain-containing protein [Achromobacter sp. R39]